MYDEAFDYYSPEETIRKIIGRNMIKYVVLNEIIDSQINNLKSFVVNVDSILIDLHKFLDKHKDFNSLNLMEVITSGIINMLAHYRYYFTLNGWYPKIYVLADKNDDNKNIRESMEVTSMILKYIDNTYFIDTTNLKTGIVIKYFLKKNKENLILSRDDFDIMHISKNTYVLRSNKDKSKFYTIYNWKQLMSRKYNPEYENIPYNLINMVLCFSGAHGRSGVKGLGYRTMLKKIFNRLDNLSNETYTNIDDFIYDMDNSLSKYDLSLARTNFNLYDVNTNYNKCITPAIEKRLDTYIEDRFSKKDLITLNTKYFTGLNSLMLEELLIRPKSEKSSSIW
jgi:hypothetical protein